MQSRSNEMERFLHSDGKVALKFIARQFKKLICDPYGKMSRTRNLDNVMRDVFGIGDFASALVSCRSDRECIATIEKVGTKVIFEMVNDDALFSAVYDLVGMDYDLHDLEYHVRKAKTKGKPIGKDTRKKLEYLLELYKDTIKAIRKAMNIDDFKKSYKKRYGAAAQLTRGGSYYGDSDSSYSVFSSSFDDDDDYGDSFDDDDYGFDEDRRDSKGNFDRYIQEQNLDKRERSPFQGDRPRKNKLQSLIQSDKLNSLYRDNDDFEPDPQLSGRVSSSDVKMDQMMDQMSALTSAIQNRQIFDTPQAEVPMKSNSAAPVASSPDKLDKVLIAVNSIATNQTKLGSTVDNLCSWAENVNEILDAITTGNDDDETPDIEDDYDSDSPASEQRMLNRIMQNHSQTTGPMTQEQERAELLQRFNQQDPRNQLPQMPPNQNVQYSGAIESPDIALSKALSGEEFPPLQAGRTITISQSVSTEIPVSNDSMPVVKEDPKVIHPIPAVSPEDNLDDDYK